jgi:hypothetical protein
MTGYKYTYPKPILLLVPKHGIVVYSTYGETYDDTPNHPPSTKHHKHAFPYRGWYRNHNDVQKGWELNHFCLFELLQHDKFLADVRTYHTRIIEVALKYKTGHILDGLHYRASPDWASLLGMSTQQLANLTAKGLDIYTNLSREYATQDTPHSRWVPYWSTR